MADVPKHDPELEGERDDRVQPRIHLPVPRDTIGVNYLLKRRCNRVCPEERRRHHIPRDFDLLQLPALDVTFVVADAVQCLSQPVFLRQRKPAPPDVDVILLLELALVVVENLFLENKKLVLFDLRAVPILDTSTHHGYRGYLTGKKGSA